MRRLQQVAYRWAQIKEQSTTAFTINGRISWTVQAVTDDFFVQAGDHGTLKPVLNALTINLFTYLLTYIIYAYINTGD